MPELGSSMQGRQFFIRHGIHILGLSTAKRLSHCKSVTVKNKCELKTNRAYISNRNSKLQSCEVLHCFSEYDIDLLGERRRKTEASTLSQSQLSWHHLCEVLVKSLL